MPAAAVNVCLCPGFDCIWKAGPVAEMCDHGCLLIICQ